MHSRNVVKFKIFSKKIKVLKLHVLFIVLQCITSNRTRFRCISVFNGSRFWYGNSDDVPRAPRLHGVFTGRRAATVRSTTTVWFHHAIWSYASRFVALSLFRFRLCNYDYIHIVHVHFLEISHVVCETIVLIKRVLLFSNISGFFIRVLVLRKLHKMMRTKWRLLK